MWITKWYADTRGADIHASTAGAAERARVRKQLTRLLDPSLEPEENAMVVLTEIVGRYRESEFPRRIRQELRVERRRRELDERGRRTL